MKILILINVFFLSFCNSNAQNNIDIKMDLSFIDNKKLNYSIVLLACDTCVPIKNIGYRVKVSLTKKELEIINNINKSTWLKLLSEINKDFASNLILYSIYRKDAFILSKFYEEYKWRKYRKDDDLIFWYSELK